MPRSAILTPTADVVLTGGLSIVVLLPLVFASSFVVDDVLEWVVIGTVLVNVPHIMGSYRLLYTSRALVARHRFAAVWFPGLLAIACVVATVAAATNRSFVPLNVVHLAAVGYLAVHYVGQTWGMMASFAQLEGVPFSPDERRDLRWSLRYILAWHLCWVARHFVPVLNESALVEWIYEAMTAGLAISMAAGAWLLVRHARRHGRRPPARIVVPWLANHVWYLLMAVVPAAAPAVQVAHALQYLPFVIRVEKNRADAQPPTEVVRKAVGQAAAFLAAGGLCLFLLPHWINPTPLPLWVGLQPAAIAACAVPLALVLFVIARRGEKTFSLVHLLSVGIALLVAGGIADWFLAPAVALGAVELLGANESLLRLGTTVSAFLSLHHYITDGVLWKLRDPAVRRELFAHVSAPA
ncbi:MAG: hypothetical protein NXI30_18715 [bacterium]|nr:hypothetical protein [bacterium]